MGAPHLLVVQTGFLGDVILSSPVWNNLQTIYPSAKLSVLTTPAAVDLVRFHPAVTETIAFDKRAADRGISGLRRVAEKLRERKFDVVFSLHKSWRTALLLKMTGIPERFGFREAAGRLCYTRTVSRKKYAHEVLRNLAILEAVGRDPSSLDQRLRLELPTESQSVAESLLSDVVSKPLIGIAPGSVWPTKRWTISGFATLARSFIAKGYGVVIIGGAEDVEVAAMVTEQSGGALNLVGRTSLVTSAAVIAKLRVLVTNDSAPMHIASAMGIPIVGVYCATIPEFGYTPWQVRSECVGLDTLVCRPCGRHGPKRCPTGTNACQEQLSPHAVIDATLRVLH